MNDRWQEGESEVAGEDTTRWGKAAEWLEKKAESLEGRVLGLKSG